MEIDHLGFCDKVTAWKPRIHCHGVVCHVTLRGSVRTIHQTADIALKRNGDANENGTYCAECVRSCGHDNMV
jgi:hypothetical protein